MKKRLLLLASALLLSAQSHAEQVSFDYSGSVYWIYRYDYVNWKITTPAEITIGNDTIGVGNTFKGTFGYDAATTLAATGLSLYEPTYTGSGASVVSTLAFDAGNAWFRSALASQPSDIQAWDNSWWGTDKLSFGGIKGSGLHIDSLQFEYSSADDTPLNGPTLPTSLAGFSGTVYMSVRDAATPGIAYSVFGTVVFSGQPVSPVPEPASYAMFLAGLGLLGWRRRQRVQAPTSA